MKWFVSEKKIAQIYWSTSAFIFLLNALDFFPATRSRVPYLIGHFLSFDNAVFETLQLIIILWIMWILARKDWNPRLSLHPFFRWSTFAMVTIIFFEEISYGAVFLGNDKYQWLVPYAKGVDFHNYDLNLTDMSEVIEFVVAFGICSFLMPYPVLRGLKQRLNFPDFQFSSFQYQMFVFSSVLGLWAIIHGSGKHDVFFENMTFYTVLICILRYNGKLEDSYDCPERTLWKPVAWFVSFLLVIRFVILNDYGEYHLFSY